MKALVLAGGYSSRAGSCKMELPLGSMSVLERTIALFEGQVSEVMVVSGYYRAAVETLVKEINSTDNYTMTINTVYNDNFPQGMFSSIRCGCFALDDQSDDRIFIIPGDMPGVSRETVLKIAAIQGDVVIPGDGRRGGHPILVSQLVCRDILRGDDSGNLRELLKNYDKRYVTVDDPGIFMDIDTPEDYEIMRGYIAGVGGEKRY